jgi:anti-anti-sigma factor
MEIAVSYEKGRVPVTVFHVKGAIDVTTHERLQQQAGAAVQAGTCDLLLDLTDVTFLSSAGLRAIHEIYNLLRSDAPEERDQAVWQGVRDGSFRSPHLKLLNPSPGVLNTLKLAGFDMFLEIHSNLKEAVDSF